jgi:hypothetical protein
MFRATKSPSLRLLAGGGVLLLGLVAAAPRTAAAQSIGLEAGISSIESFDGVRPTLGLSLFLPLTERLKLAVSGTQWTGCPETGCDEPRSGYGNRGLNVLGFFNIVGESRTKVSLGAGMGWYEMKELEAGGTESETSYNEAFTFAVEVRRDVAYNSGLYLRGETSVPTDDDNARWGSLRLGADVRIF